MIKFITILIGCSLALAVGVRAEQQEDPKKKKEEKSKPVLKQQSVPKPHVNTHVQSLHTQHTDTPVESKMKLHDNNVTKHQLNTLPAVQVNKTEKLPNAEFHNKTVKAFHVEHHNFHATPNSAIVSMKFNQNFHIHGADKWKGPHYQVYQSYHPQWHDKVWWHSHHTRIVLIGGGWYYWDGGYWYPAWGYDDSAAYYPYDGPVYSGPSAAPLDQVIADVQSALQEQGYYHGEIDGLIGPQTRQALGEYQQAHGLYATETIDQPTLASLGLES